MHPHALLHLAALPPNDSILVGTVGVCLIFLELNRPGRVLPGAVGLLLVLLSINSCLRWPLRPWAPALLLLGSLILIGNVWLKLPSLLLVLASIALAVGLRYLLDPSLEEQVSRGTALLCSALVGALGAFLSRMAFRARRAKAVD